MPNALKNPATIMEFITNQDEQCPDPQTHTGICVSRVLRGPVLQLEWSLMQLLVLHISTTYLAQLLLSSLWQVWWRDVSQPSWSPVLFRVSTAEVSLSKTLVDGGSVLDVTDLWWYSSSFWRIKTFQVWLFLTCNVTLTGERGQSEGCLFVCLFVWSFIYLFTVPLHDETARWKDFLTCEGWTMEDFSLLLTLQLMRS